MKNAPTNLKGLLNFYPPVSHLQWVNVSEKERERLTLIWRFIIYGAGREKVTIFVLIKKPDYCTPCGSIPRPGKSFWTSESSCCSVDSIPHGNQRLLSWIGDYFTKRTDKVRFQGQLSQHIPLENGTPQGRVLSPSLFNILISCILNITFLRAVR